MLSEAYRLDALVNRPYKLDSRKLIRPRARVTPGSSGPSRVSTWGNNGRAASKSSLSIEWNSRRKRALTESFRAGVSINSSKTRLESIPKERSGVVTLLSSLSSSARISSERNSPITCGE
jgi:hypothetical protein